MEPEAGQGPVLDATQRSEHPDVLENQTPGLVTETLGQVLLFLQSYGWFVIFAVIILAFLKSKLTPFLEKKRRQREDAAHHRNYDSPEQMQRQEAMLAARAKLQQDHDALAERYSEQQQQKEEERRKERIEDWNRHQDGHGYRSRYKPQDESSSSNTREQKKDKPVYRTSNYNPLSGGGGPSGSTYRPPRRNVGGGG